MDIDRYIAECARMARLAAQDEILRNVYADCNFQKLLDKAEAYRTEQHYLEIADYIFNNVSQNDCAAAQAPPDAES